MSEYLEKLKCLARGCIDVHNSRDVKDILDHIDSLGKNATRMLEIGGLQDALVQLGFEPSSASRMAFLRNKELKIEVYISLPDEQIRVYQKQSDSDTLVDFYTLEEVNVAFNKVRGLIKTEGNGDDRAS